MSNYQPSSPLALAKSDQKRLNKLERRANPSGRIAAIEEELATFSRRNKIINGDCRINQRGYTSGSSIGIGMYAFDRWKMTSTQVNLASNPVGVIDSTPSGYDWVGMSSGTLTILSGLTIPGLSGVTTAVRATATGTPTGGLYLRGLAGNGIRVVVGQTYRMSMWVRSSVAITIPLGIQWANSTLSGISATTGTGVALPANTWTRIDVTGTAPVNAAYAGVYAYRTSGTWAAGNTLDATGVLIEPGSTLNSFYMPPTMMFTSAPQGQLVTIANGNFAQIIERSNMAAGTYIVSHAGTARVRVYNSGSGAPAFSATSVTVVIDGLADVVVEFEGPAAGATFGFVQLERGSEATPFEHLLIGEALALCQRYYWRFAAVGTDVQAFSGAFYTSTLLYGTMDFPVEMRVPPTARWSSVAMFRIQYQGVNTITNAVGFTISSTLRTRASVSTPGSSTAGYSGWCELLSGHWVEFDAEL